MATVKRKEKGNTMKRRAHVTISGDVIGVGFRAWVVSQARKTGITGWVKNTPENTVEAVCEGEEEDLETLIEECHTGPMTAWVEHVSVVWEEYVGEFDDMIQS